MKQNIYLCGALLALAMTSCSQDGPTASDIEQIKVTESLPLNQELARKDFAMALSKAVAGTPELAVFLRDEAQKEFDNNTDVLYHLVKDSKLPSGKSVRELILSQWKNEEETFSSFEAQNPLLNIFAPDLSVFDESLALGSWDLAEGVGVATADGKEEYTLYVAGDSVYSIGKGEVPAIPTFVVGENRRVEVASTLRSLDGRSPGFTYRGLRLYNISNGTVTATFVPLRY